MDGEPAVSRALKLALGGLELNPLGITAEAVPMMQHGAMPVGEICRHVKFVRSHLAESAQVWLDMGEECRLKVEREKIFKIPVRLVEVPTARIGRNRRIRPRRASTCCCTITGQPLPLLVLCLETDRFRAASWPDVPSAVVGWP